MTRPEQAHVRARKLSGAVRGLVASALVGALLATGAAPVLAANKSKLTIYQHGKPIDAPPCAANATRTAVLMGGGVDVKEADSWMISKMVLCDGRHGNFVVIRAGGNPSYDSFIYKLGQVASVQTVVVPTADAANNPDPALISLIRNASAIWLTGGDQGDYYNFWKGSLLERLVSEQVRTYSIPVGGTSAGMMILSEFNYIAYPNTINSFDALHDPYKTDSVTLKKDFWDNGTPFSPEYYWNNRTPFPPLLNTVTDSHFDTRDRMGRLVTFLARVVRDGWTDTTAARAIGVDQETALLMEYDASADPAADAARYTARVVANPGVSGAAYVLSVGAGNNRVVEPGVPLTFTNVSVQKFPSTGGEREYFINVDQGDISSTNDDGSLY